MKTALSAEHIKTALASLPDWGFSDGKLRREFKFADFSQAFAFLTRVALAAEKSDHHPDIHNSFSAVTLELSSHDAGGVTTRDLELAADIDKLLD